ncbi:uncharacterized protein [Haliotis cracherodii]|uniref:uncharacterized protein n=1 Tax=Haliotis cracherodii TaxID=6455 RepID=UPI0039EB0ABE
MLTPGTALIFISVFLTHAVAACEWGKYGENCDTRCPPNCQVNPQRNLTHCNKDTGECSDGCITGWYDPQCDQHCSKNCLDNVCNHGNGHCTRGCSGNQIGDFCEVTEDVKVKTDETTGVSTAHVAVIITISLVASIVIIIVAVVIKRRRQRSNRRRSTRRPKAGTDPEDPEGEPLLSNILKRETEQVFVVTALYNKVKERLEKFRHVTISGAAGEGKTSMALMLGSEYQNKGYELYFVDDISQFKLSVVVQDKDQCFIFDDIFGTVGMSTDSLHLGQMLHHLNFCLEQKTSAVSETFLKNTNRRNINNGKTLIIFTTKSYNLKQGISHLKETYQYVFFKGASVIDLTQTQYTVDEKRQMFLKHKENMKYDCDLEEICDIKDNMFGFPLTCKLFFIFLKSHKRYKQTLWAPLSYLRRELEVLLSKMNNESAALILMLLCDGKLNMRQLEIKSSNEVLEDHLSIVSSFVNNFNRAKVITCVRDFFGTYFTKGDITRFAHPSIYDACAIVLYEINHAFVLQHCSIRFLYERVQAQTAHACETDEDRHVIYLSDAYNDIIASRLAGAVREGNYRMSIMHPILERHDVVDKVLAELQSFLDDTSVTDEHGNNMFHYACYTGNIYLVRQLIPFCDINSKGADGVTPTRISVLLGLDDLFKLLVSNGADLTLTDDDKDNVLHLACQGGNRSFVEYLLPSFDINSRGQYGWTAVMGAALSEKKDTFDLLVSKGADLTLTDDDKDTVLHLACQGGNRSIVEHLLPSFDINCRGQYDRTALMVAAMCAQKDVVDLLVSKGADLTLTDDHKNTTLHLACQDGNRSIVEYLLPSFDINCRGQYGWTAVMGAALSEKKDTFDLLVSKGADLTLTDDDKDTVLHLACQGGNRSIVEYLLPSFDINCRGQYGWTAVVGAALSEKKDTFDLLVSKGADLTLTDDDKDTVLHLACQGGNRSIVEHLLPSFDINCRGQYDRTALMVAAMCAQKDVVDLLVSKGADLTLTDDHKTTTLHLACQGGNRSIVEYLLPSFDINCRGQYGWTAVMGAALSEKKDTFDLLVSKGADLTLTDDDKDTVLHLACQGGNMSIVEYLLPLFDINIRGQHGWTAVMKAAVCAKKDTFDLLVSKGADLTLTDDDKDTVLHLACQGGNRSIVEYLLPSFDINCRGQYGWTAVMGAALSEKKDTFDLLVSKGADLTLTDDDKDTVLHLACQGGNRSIVEHLLPSFDINCRGQYDRTALMVAAMCAQKDVVDLLVSKGADLTLTDDHKNTTLHLACQGGNRSIVEYLLPSFDINCRGQYGWTAVMGAALSEKKDTFDLLVSKGADLTLTDDDKDTVLHLACQGGNRSIVEHLLPSFDINCRGQYDRTALMVAAMCAQKDVVDLLVSKGADLTLTDDHKNTTLHLACQGGNRSIVEYLLPSFDINCRGQYGWTAVMGAALSEKKDTFDLLVSKGADLTLTDDDKDTVLHLACQGGNRSIVEHLLPSFDINCRGQYDRTALMVAAMCAQKDVVDLLVSKGADLTLTDDHKNTTLHLACQGGNRSIVEYLLPSFDINCRGQYGWTAVMGAALSEKKDTFDLLVSKGADLTLTDDDKDTVLHLACQGGNRSIVEHLLPSFDINCRGQYDRTALMVAAMCAQKDVVDLLVSKGADLTLTDDHKNTTLHLACQDGNRSIVEHLLPSFDINCRGQYDRTALMVAAMCAQKDVVDLLVSKGADIAMTDDDKNTVLHLACQGGNMSIVEYLLPLFDINIRGQHGWTAVMKAAVCAKKDTFDLLVSKGADLTLTDDHKNTVLHLACQGGNRSIVEYLLPSFDINCRGQYGWTAVMGAALSEKKDTFDLLVSKGADLTLTDDDKDTVLHLACQGGNRSIVEHLLPSFDINCRGQYDRTALMVAAMCAQKDVVDLLVSKGADLTLTDDHKNTTLHLACQGGNRSIVEHLLPSFDINCRGQYDRTALMVAAMCAQKDVVDLLVSIGADLTLTDDNNNTTLHLACQGGNRSIVEYLLPSFDINCRGQYGWTAVMGAALSEKKDTFDLLVSKGADLTLTDDDKDTVLHLACQGGNRSIVEHLLPSFDINCRGQYDRTALMVAAMFAQKDVVDLLVSKGADLTLTDDHKNTTLHLACQGGNRSIVEYLLPSFDINCRGQYGWTAVMGAALSEKKDTFDLLVSKGADLTLTDDDKDTVLHLACQGGNRSIVEHLLPSFDINCRGQYDRTALMVAAMCAQKDVVDLLVSKGADLTLTDDHKNTTLHLACQDGNRSIVEHLLPSFDINCRGQYDRTALMVAAMCAQKDVVDLLVSKGADIAMTDDDKNTVLHLACQGGNMSIVEYMLPLFDINIRGQHGWTAVMKAAVCAKKDVVDLLVSKGADLTLTDDNKDTVLHLACQGANILIVEHLLPMCDINCRGYKGWTPVMKGAYSGNKDTFDLLLSKGANPSLTGDDNETLLHAASEGGNIDIVRHVIGDFDINTRGGNGHTPLMLAVGEGYTDVVDFLVDHGADVHMVDNDGDCLLHLACELGNVNMAKHVRSYSDFELRNKFGWTPVAEAAVDGNFAVFKYLKIEGAHLTLFDKTGDDLATLALQGGCRAIRDELGFDVSLRFTPWNRLMKSLVKSKMYCLEHYDQMSPDLVQTDQYGDSLLHLACRGGNRQCVGYLLPSYDINVRGRYGWTPVMMAAVCAHYEVFQLLVSQKADLTLASDRGEDILTLARRGKNDGIVKFLLEES